MGALVSTAQVIPCQKLAGGRQLDAAHPASDWPLPDQVRQQLAEVASALRGQPPPLDAELLAVALRGLAELCRLLHERGHEAGARPPVLICDNPVIAEALGMWATRLACHARERHAPAGQGAQQP
jgi:hypothetical protein